MFGIEQLRRLGHEMHAGQNDDIGLDVHRLARKGEAVADDVGDAVKNFGRLIIMREHDRVAAALQRHDGVNVGSVERPLDGGNGVADPRIEIPGVGLRVMGAWSGPNKALARRERLNAIHLPAQPSPYTPFEHFTLHMLGMSIRFVKPWRWAVSCRRWRVR